MHKPQRWAELAAGSILFALAMIALLAAPGLLSEQSSTATAVAHGYSGERAAP